VTDIDNFARLLFEEAKRFLEKGRESCGDGRTAYLHAAINLSFSALEAHVNAIADELLIRKDNSLIDKSILSEKDLKLNNGRFELTGQKIYRLQDRLEFLCRRYSNAPIDKNAAYWSHLKEAIDLRNHLTHPKNDPPKIGVESAEKSLTAILEILNELFVRIYKKGYPGFKRHLDSTMTF